MATLDDLPNVDITLLSDEELKAALRLTRGRRVVPDKAIKARSIKVAMGRAKAKPIAAMNAKTLMKDVAPDDVAKLLTLLGGV